MEKEEVNKTLLSITNDFKEKSDKLLSAAKGLTQLNSGLKTRIEDYESCHQEMIGYVEQFKQEVMKSKDLSQKAKNELIQEWDQYLEIYTEISDGVRDFYDKLTSIKL
ncbi:MAG: hypothetical protein ISS23_00160 [Nanoarchaeota archaeon]|nr:hypothetical protein [Nanoarchaeota archaeon]